MIGAMKFGDLLKFRNLVLNTTSRITGLDNLASGAVPEGAADIRDVKRFHRITQSCSTSIETLEDRIAPAALAGQVLTYTDIDGDHVSVTISKGTLAQANFTFNVTSPFSTANATTPMQLQEIDIHGDAGVSGANIIVKVTKAGAGDGLAAIGAINAQGIDLGTVSIPGDLGFLTAGSNGVSNVAIKSLTVHSLGANGEATQAAGSPSLASVIAGHLGSLTIARDMASSASLTINDTAAAANNGLGPVTIGGSLFGALESKGGGIGLVTVKGSIVGGNLLEDAGGISGIKVSGSILLNANVIDASGAIGPVTIGGSLYDAASIQSSAGSIGAIKIGGSVYSQSAINSSGNIGTIQIAGSISNSSIEISGTGSVPSISVGGDLTDSAVVQTNSGNIGSLSVRGSMGTGAVVSTASGNIGALKMGGDFLTSAGIGSSGTLGAVTVGGSVAGSISAVAGITSVAIRGDFSGLVAASAGNIGAVTIGGDFIGATINGAGTLGAVKIAGLLTDAGIQTIGSIASVTVGKSVISSQILAGTAMTSSGAVNIGLVKVGGDWIGSNLSAGVAGTSGDFGNATDTLKAASSRITSITIGGLILGSSGSMHHFGFDAEAIGSFTYNKIKLKLPTTFPANIPLTPITADVAIELI